MSLNFSLFITALDFAAEKHRLQRRKGKNDIPYINHPIKVAKVLSEVGLVNDTNVLMAALLHDTIEDTEATAEELDFLFGKQVTAIVLEVTDDKSMEWQQRKNHQIVKAPNLSKEAKLVKLADKICNITDVVNEPPDWLVERKRKYLVWAKKVVDALGGNVNKNLEERFDEQYRMGMEVLR
ncbi:MAG: HD domain-containing protein [Chitinophagales bacterium]